MAPGANDSFFLSTQRLGFRRWTEADLPLAMALWGDPQVTRLIGGPFSPRQVQDRLASEIESQAVHGIQYWPVFSRADGEFVGCCGLRPYPESEHIYELGFHLRRPFWGQGLAFEAASAVVVFAFESLGAQSLFAGHHPENMPSKKVLERLGFCHDHDEFYPPTGLLHPSYRLLAPDKR